MKPGSMKFKSLPEFERDLRRLSRRYKTIGDDLQVIKKILALQPEARPPFSELLEDPDLGCKTIKVKHFATKSLKGAGVLSGLQLIYDYLEDKETIVFVGLFHRPDDRRQARIVNRAR